MRDPRDVDGRLSAYELLVTRIVNEAMRRGESESSTEAQYRHALKWAEDQSASADPGDETKALEEAIGRLTRKLDQIVYPNGPIPNPRGTGQLA